MAAQERPAGEEEGGNSPDGLIDARIAALGDWRGEALALVRTTVAANRARSA